MSAQKDFPLGNNPLIFDFIGADINFQPIKLDYISSFAPSISIKAGKV
jgi:hypothetical protein